MDHAVEAAGHCCPAPLSLWRAQVMAFLAVTLSMPMASTSAGTLSTSGSNLCDSRHARACADRSAMRCESFTAVGARYDNRVEQEVRLNVSEPVRELVEQFPMMGYLLGVTQAPLRVQARFVDTQTAERTCASPVLIIYSISQQTVFIAREVESDPCLAKDTLRHEMEHVRINREGMSDAARALEEKIRLAGGSLKLSLGDAMALTASIDSRNQDFDEAESHQTSCGVGLQTMIRRLARNL